MNTTQRKGSEMAGEGSKIRVLKPRKLEAIRGDEMGEVGAVFKEGNHFARSEKSHSRSHPFRWPFEGVRFIVRYLVSSGGKPL